MPRIGLVKINKGPAKIVQPSSSLSIVSVDTHAHVFEPSLPMVPGRRYTPTYEASLATYLRLLDTNGFSHGVLVQPSFLGTDNRFLIQALEQASGRCRGVAVVDPAVDSRVLAQMNDSGIVGIRLNLFGVNEPDLSGPEWRTLLQRINQYDWHVEIHCPAANVFRVASELIGQGCKVVVDHCGRPDFSTHFDEAQLDPLLGLARTGHIWVKLSAPYRFLPENFVHNKALISLFMHAFTPQRLMWGSDWPHTQHESLNDFDSSLQWLKQAVDNPENLSPILCDTPRTLFKF